MLRQCLKALLLPLPVHIQIVVSIDWAVFSIYLEVGTVWGAV